MPFVAKRPLLIKLITKILCNANNFISKISKQKGFGLYKNTPPPPPSKSKKPIII